MKIGTLNINDGKVGSRLVEKAYLGSNLVWQKQSPVTMDYFTITNNDSSSTLIRMIDAVNQNIEYSLDGGSTWTDWGETEWAGISLASGQSVKFKGVNDTFNLSDADYCTFDLDNNGNLSLSGNIMSLVDGQADGTKIIPSTYFFYGLFDSCTIIRDASQLVLPATTLSEYCYGKLFYGCSSLTAAPALPATILSDYCYHYMFSNCSSLTIAPALPATNLSERCYLSMFYNCSSLTAAPALPATTLAVWCYYYMFYGCSSLTTTPLLPAQSINTGSYGSMFRDCTGILATSDIYATSLNKYSCQYMFLNCSNLTAGPDLLSTSLQANCYQAMFLNCSKLSSIICMATNISANKCLTSWMSGVSATGTFTKAASMSSWPSGASGIPAGWTILSI